VYPKKSANDGKESRSAAPCRAEAIAAGDRAVNPLQLIGDNNWTASSPTKQKHEKEQRGQNNDKQHAGHEPLKQRGPNWLERSHAHQPV